MEFQSKHNLPFEIAKWQPFSAGPIINDFMRFRVGTCEGLWRSTLDSYDILAITNKIPNNGHFIDVLHWFEYSCRRDKKVLRILEVRNVNLKKHLINKQSFKEIDSDNLEKNFFDIKETKKLNNVTRTTIRKPILD
jgi:hypothetical protein